MPSFVKRPWFILLGVWALFGVLGFLWGLGRGRRQALQRPTAETTLVPVELAATYVAQTVEALQTRQALPPQASATPAVTSTPTFTATPQATPTPRFSPTPSLTPTITNTPLPCHLGYLAGETVPDGTKMEPGQAFTKTWRLLNGGRCTWTQQYKVVFVSGNRMGGPETVTMPLEVPPGRIVDISIAFIAPEEPGVYRADFMLQDEEGHRFGMGPEEGPFWVQIEVVGPTAAPTATPTPTP